MITPRGVDRTKDMNTDKVDKVLRGKCCDLKVYPTVIATGILWMTTLTAKTTMVPNSS